MDQQYPRTDAVFRVLALAMHPETGAEHFAGFMREVRTLVEAIEHELADATAQIAAMRAHDERRLESDSEIGDCECLTKSPDIAYHKPGCRYRLIIERDEARHQYAEAIMDAGEARIERDSARMELDLTKKEWIEWHGGERPVPEGTKLVVRLRHGSELVADRPERWWWSHFGGGGDIVAYRLADSP